MVGPIFIKFQGLLTVCGWNAIVTGERVCGKDEFTCRSGHGECVPLTWMCDDNPDCTDGSDEKACSKGKNKISFFIF